MTTVELRRKEIFEKLNIDANNYTEEELDAIYEVGKIADNIEFLNTILKKEDVPNFNPEYKFKPEIAYSSFGYSCCEKCNNNPKNGGSGICHCILPLVERPIK